MSSRGLPDHRCNSGGRAASLVKINGEIGDQSKISVVFQSNPAKKNTLGSCHRDRGRQRVLLGRKDPGGIRDNHLFKVEAAADGKLGTIQSDKIMGGFTFLMGSRLAKIY